MAQKKKRAHQPRSAVRLFVFECIFMIGLGVAAYFISTYQKIGYEELEDDIFVGGQEKQTEKSGSDKGQLTNGIENSNEEENRILEVQAVDTHTKITNYRNILLVGVDARDQSTVTKGANADVLMLVNINEATGDVKLVSILRDTLLRLIDGGSYYPNRLYDKANAQNCYTDISDTVSMINLNLDLDIEEYVAVNWASAAKIVDTIGGVEVTIDNEEILSYLNGYLTEVNEETGIFAPQLQETGTQVLSGTQAVSFCRIRYAGLEDSGRTKNQREVIIRILDKMKQLLFEKPSVVMAAVNQAAESVVTNLSLKDIGALAFKAGTFHIVDHCSFPFQYRTGKNVGRVTEITQGVKDILVADDLEKNVLLLHQYLYGENADGYEVPEYVRQISEDIRWMAGDN